MKIKRNRLSSKTLATLKKLERNQRLVGQHGQYRSKTWDGKISPQQERKLVKKELNNNQE